MMFGLKPEDIELIREALRQAPEVERAVVFGSRAKGNNSAGSDIDLAIEGKEITEQTLARVREMLEEELPLPYFFDVVRYESIHNKDLLHHIQRVGKELYRKS